MKTITLRLFVGIILAVELFCVYNAFSQEVSMTPNDTMAIIHRRKSVRTYTDKPVSVDLLEILVKAGMAAPTAADKRPWAFVVITQRDVLDRLAEGLEYGKMLKNAQAAIAVCGIPEESLPGISQMYWVQDCSAATQNILLAAESKNLGAVWLGIYPENDRIDFVRSVLSIPSNVVPLNVISIGYPAGLERPKDKYDPDKIHWNKW
ncbi:MAG: nitroreductase family protein [Candidatus Auribacterota bacterium]|jgi:nitroreductase|nr:nitroreductase family protein [Candidatus Auribacterota bacterium]